MGQTDFDARNWRDACRDANRYADVLQAQLRASRELSQRLAAALREVAADVSPYRPSRNRYVEVWMTREVHQGLKEWLAGGCYGVPHFDPKEDQS